MLALSGLGGSDGKPSHHVYELRLYHVKEGKIDALKARFGNHTDSIFKRHNMQADAEWQKVKAESEANGPLVDHIDRYFMDPTSFSTLQ